MTYLSSTLKKILLGAVAVILAVILVPFAIGTKFNLGKFLNDFLGRQKVKEGDIVLAERNAVPDKRKVDVGEPDSRGQVQLEHKRIKRRLNPWRDKSVVKTEDGKEHSLPDGVTDSDVSSIVVIEGEVTVAKVDPPKGVRVQTAQDVKDMMDEIRRRNNA